MAVDSNVELLGSVYAAADYSAGQYTFGYIDATANTATVTQVSVLGAVADGVIYNKPKAGQAVDFAVDGNRLKVQVGAAAVAAGDKITPDATGKAKTAVATNNVAGIALEAGVAGAVIAFLPKLKGRPVA